MASKVEDDINYSTDLVCSDPNACQNGGKCPSEDGQSAGMSEDINLQLRSEIQLGFEILAAKLAAEFQTLRSELSRDVHIPDHHLTVDGMLHVQQTGHCPDSHAVPSVTPGQDEHHQCRPSEGFFEAAIQDDQGRKTYTSRSSEGFFEAAIQNNQGRKGFSSRLTDFEAATQKALKRFHGRLKTQSLQIRPLEKSVVHQIERSGGCFRAHLHDVLVDLRDRQLKDAAMPNNCFTRWVRSKFFAFLSFFVIALNAAWMGYECSLAVDEPTLFELSVNTGFTSWFVLELVLRILALRKYFIFGEDWMWNMLDFFLVLTSIPEFFSNSMNMTFLRLVRLCKLTRAFRLVRLVRFVASLREIMFSLVYTLGSLFWSFVALALVSYIFALIFMQSLLLQPQDGVEFDPKVELNFRDTGTTMLSLFSMISGGQDWYELAQEFSSKNDYLSMYALVFFIFFMVFGFVNVIIGVFCAKATDASNADDQLRVAKEEEKRTKKVKDLVQIFNEIASVRTESDGGLDLEGRIDWQRFTPYFDTSDSQNKLQSHGLQIFNLNKLWQVMDTYDGCPDGKVDLQSFVMGVMRLAGEAKSTELVMLSVQVE